MTLLLRLPLRALLSRDGQTATHKQARMKLRLALIIVIDLSIRSGAQGVPRNWVIDFQPAAHGSIDQADAV